MPASNAAFANAFAPLVEVLQRGLARPATPADVLELIDPPRYVLKRKDAYLADKGKGWTRRQREALIAEHIDAAREGQTIGRREHGIEVRIVRIRRRGTLGIQAYRLRPDIKVNDAKDGMLELIMSHPEAMDLLAALTGATDSSGTA